MDQLKLLELIVLSNAVADSLIVGRKAANLAALKEKFSIPEWFVISPQAFFNSLSSLQLEALNKGDSVRNFVLNKAILESIQSALKKIMLEDSECFAVRSSAVDEDSEQASFAGQLESFLNVAPNQIPEKIYAVWNSAFSEHIMHYRKTFTNNQHGIPAVIVQRMVKAEIAGVAFSADPLTGHSDICVINATLGLGEKLMSGEVSGDTYFLNKNGILKKQNLIGQSAILNSENISKIIKLLLEVEKHFGVAQDIEWAIEKDVLYLLQARPITTLKNQTIAGSKRIVWDNSNIVESYSGVTAPLTFSFARYIYEHVYIEFCKLMGVSKSKIDSESNSFRNMLGYVNGHIYYHLLNWYRVLALFPGFKINRKYMEEMMGVKEALPEELISEIIQKKPTMFEKIIDIFSLTRTLGGLICQQIIFKKTIRSFYERLNKALKTSENLQKLSLEQLATEYRLLEKKLLKAWDAPLVNDFLCMIAFGLSRKLLEKYVGNEGLNFHNEIMIRRSHRLRSLVRSLILTSTYALSS
ncbi:MAG: PEP/pyruvate-binding domain-containing protein [Gammaproteobacteria bacterium]